MLVESPSSSGLLAAERVRFTGSPECGQERLQRNRSPGDFRSLPGASSKSKIVTLFDFILKIRCATVCEVFLALWLLELLFSCHCVCLTSAHLCKLCMCCRDFEGFFLPVLSARGIMYPTSQAPLCLFVLNWLADGAWRACGSHPSLRPLGISPRVV